MNATLEAMARALFRSWFVSFDPVRAKMQGRDTGLPEEVADLFPDGFAESRSELVPMGWQTGVVGDLAQVSSGKRPRAKHSEASSAARVPLWGGNGPMAFVPEALLDRPVLLTGRVGTLGSVFRITSPCWPSDNTLVLDVKDQRAFDYLFFELQRKDLRALNRGSTQPLLTQTDLKGVRILLPPIEILEYYSSWALAAFGRIESGRRESRHLGAIRDAMLPRLVSGELRVNGLEPPNRHDDLPAAVEAHGA